MTKTSILTMAAIAAAVLALPSCTENGVSVNTSHNGRVESPFYSYTGSRELVDGALYVQRTQAGGVTTVVDRADFYDSTGNVLVGGVTLNGSSLASHATGEYYESTADPGFGGNHIWDVTGSGNHPSFTDTFPSPQALSISSPGYHYDGSISDNVPDTVSRSSFTVTWSGSGSNDVVIRLQYDSIYNARIADYFGRTIPSQNDTLVIVNTADDGSYTFSSAAFSGMPDTAWVEISVYRYGYETVTHGGMKYAIGVINGGRVTAEIH